MAGTVSLTLAMTARERASFCGAFDHHDVIGLLDGDAVVAAALEVVDAVGELLDRHGNRRGREAPDLVRHWKFTGAFFVTEATDSSSTGWPP